MIPNVKLRARKAQWATGLYWGNHVALRNSPNPKSIIWTLGIGHWDLIRIIRNLNQ